MRENRTSGSMRGCWRSRTVGLVRHRQTKGAGTARLDLPAGGQCSNLPPDVPPDDDSDDLLPDVLGDLAVRKSRFGVRRWLSLRMTGRHLGRRAVDRPR